MAKHQRKKTTKLKGGFSLGGEQAEADPLLSEAFIEWAGYSCVESRDDPHRFLIGRTGSGKSAVLQRIEDIHPSRVVRINPEDLSLPYIVDLGVIHYLDDLNVHLDPLFIALWKHVLIIEVIKHRYQVNSPTKKRTVLTSIREAVARDTSKREALDYLDDFGESFWCETHERVREITTNFENKVQAAAALTANVPGLPGGKLGYEGSRGETTTVRTEEANRYQRLVNETQLPRLNKMIAVLDEHILSSSQDFTYVLIDDLDRDWVDDRIANDLIRCLFRAVLDLQRVKNLKIIVALRTNIFDHLSFGSRGGGQEEKYRALQCRISWTRNELRELADERARLAAARAGIEGITSIAKLLPVAGKRGNPFDHMLERTLMRPRDLIAYLNECVHQATGKSRLSWQDINAAEAEYSYNRLLALRDEWKPNYPGIDRVFEIFRGAPRKMNQQELTKYLDDAALLTAERDFEGVVWLTEISEPLWTGAMEPQEWSDSYRPTVKFLYDIGFLGISHGSEMYFSYNRSGYADADQNLGPGVLYEVHPAFHASLGVRKRVER